MRWVLGACRQVTPDVVVLVANMSDDVLRNNKCRRRCCARYTVEGLLSAKAVGRADPGQLPVVIPEEVIRSRKPRDAFLEIFFFTILALCTACVTPAID